MVLLRKEDVMGMAGWKGTSGLANASSLGLRSVSSVVPELGAVSLTQRRRKWTVRRVTRSVAMWFSF
jgi:two-component sensor histidine kinase